jgi:SlyX protein
MNDDKFVDIESKLAHQEHMLAELNDALSSQQAQITGLEGLVRSLIERVKGMSESATGASDEKPPHY